MKKETIKEVMAQPIFIFAMSLFSMFFLGWAGGAAAASLRHGNFQQDFFAICILLFISFLFGWVRKIALRYRADSYNNRPDNASK
jgi:hypothetical protein